METQKVNTKQLSPYFLLSIKEKYIGGKLIYNYRNDKNKKINQATTITDIIIKENASTTCLTVMGKEFIYGFKLPDLRIYETYNHLVMKSVIKEIECCIYEKVTEKYLIVETITEKIVKLLESKRDSWLGQEGEMARQNFKDGIDWSIDTIKTINAELFEGQKSTKIDNIIFADIDHEDHPDYCDVFIESADYNGEEMTEQQLDELNEDREFVHEKLFDYLF